MTTRKKAPKRNYIAVAYAKHGKLMIGGVKEWQSAPQEDRHEAAEMLRGWIDGQRNVGAHGIRTIYPPSHVPLCEND